jgi:long-chain acyl-CoA synthetase
VLTLADPLEHARKLHAARTAIIDGDQRFTYAALHERSHRLGAALCALGLRKGDRVALLAANGHRYFEAFYGVPSHGLVLVPLNTRLATPELCTILERSGARVLLTDRDPGPLATRVERVVLMPEAYESLLETAGPNAAAQRPTLHEDDLAALFYTGGTTGTPKGVMLTHRNLMTMALSYFVDVDAVAATDAMVYAAPMSHGCGLYAIPHLMAGARHVVPVSGGVDAAELFALGRALGPLSTFAAPTIVRRLVDHAEAAGLTPADAAAAFKTIVYGGAPMYEADIRRALRVMGPRFVQIYGQGETPMVGTVLSRAFIADAAHPRHARRLASVGVVQTPVQLRVADARGRTLPVGETGEVLVRGDTVMAGYWRNPEASTLALRDGWLWTGDIGSLDGDGLLTLKDRSKDLVISGGSNIYPREVEEVLLTAPGVAEVAVVGAPDAEWGEVVVAFVVLQAGAVPDAAALDSHCLAQLARFKRPRRYVFVDSLPKNHYGKLLKTALRARLRDEAADATADMNPGRV